MRNALESLKNPSTSLIENGINALELIDSPAITTETLTNAVAVLEANFGAEIPKEKVKLLFEMIREDGWSEKRFELTLKWFLRNKPYPSWTISDWFSYGIKLYPEAWYLQQCQPGFDARKKMDRYKIAEGVIGYCWKGTVELPLEKLPEIS